MVESTAPGLSAAWRVRPLTGHLLTQLQNRRFRENFERDFSRQGLLGGGM